MSTTTSLVDELHRHHRPAPRTTATTTGAPERTLVQRMEALHEANRIRAKRAQIKRDLKAGRVKLVDLLLDPPEYLETTKVYDLLLAVPKVGRVKANKALAHVRMSPSKTMGGATQRQRTELASMLRH